MKKLTLVLLALGLISFTWAQEKELPPEGGEPKGFELPNKTVINYDNGLTLVMVPWGSLPKASVQVTVKTGNIHELEDEVWLSDVLADLMKEGSTSMTADEIANKISGMGGGMNVGVSPHTTTFSANVLEEFADDALTIMADVIMNPALPENELSRLVNDNKRSLSVAMTSAQSQATAAFYAAMYPDHPYGRVFPTAEMLDSYTLDKVKNFYNTNFGGKRTTIYVAGKFDLEAVKAVAKSSLANWQAGPESFYPVAEPVIASSVSIEDRPDAPQTTLRFGLPVVDQGHEDYNALYLANQILGGAFSSRITSNIREDKGYTYSPYSTIDDNYQGGIWFQAADVTTADTGNALKEILYEIDRMQTDTVPEEELQGMKNYETGIYVLRNATPGGIIAQLRNLDVYDLDESTLTDYVANINAVTVDQIRDMVRKYIRPDEMALVTVGDKKVIEKQVDEFKKSIKKTSISN